jgi:uncharacterized membrane protein
MAILVLALVIIASVGVLAALEHVPTHVRKKAGPSF